MKKNKTQEYQIKFIVKAIISVDVNAKTFEEAQQKADAIKEKGIFVKEFDYIDGKINQCGYDNMDDWESVQ